MKLIGTSDHAADFGNTHRCHLRTEHARATLRFGAPGASIETL